jgi:hypothetical protein
MAKCMVCGQVMKFIQNTHLKKHNMTLDEYRELYPDAVTLDSDTRAEITRTRFRNKRVPIKFCKREGCDNTVTNWRENVYCSSRCNALDNPKVGLHHKGYASFGKDNPKYIDGDYSHCKAQKQKAYERDNGCCVQCGVSVDGITDRYGVHHLVPRRLIEDKELADNLGNLVTLCSKHHKEVESRFADEIFALYSANDIKPLEDLILHLRSKL